MYESKNHFLSSRCADGLNVEIQLVKNVRLLHSRCPLGAVKVKPTPDAQQALWHPSWCAKPSSLYPLLTHSCFGKLRRLVGCLLLCSSRLIPMQMVFSLEPSLMLKGPLFIWMRCQGPWPKVCFWWAGTENRLGDWNDVRFPVWITFPVRPAIKPLHLK